MGSHGDSVEGALAHIGLEGRDPHLVSVLIKVKGRDGKKNYSPVNSSTLRLSFLTSYPFNVLKNRDLSFWHGSRKSAERRSVRCDI